MGGARSAATPGWDLISSPLTRIQVLWASACGRNMTTGVYTADGIALAYIRRTRIESLAPAGDDQENHIQIPCTALLKEPCTILQTRSMTMRRITGWILGGLVTMALWVPGAGAQDGRRMYQGMRHDWRNLRQDRPTSNYQALPTDRAALHRDRTDLRTERRDVGREIYQD